MQGDGGHGVGPIDRLIQQVIRECAALAPQPEPVQMVFAERHGSPVVAKSDVEDLSGRRRPLPCASVYGKDHLALTRRWSPGRFASAAPDPLTSLWIIPPSPERRVTHRPCRRRRLFNVTVN